jgi:hypothetical protein
MTLLLLTSIYISWPYLIFKFSIARSLEQKGTINLSIWPTHLQIYVVKFDPTWETPLINLDLNPLDFFFLFFSESQIDLNLIRSESERFEIQNDLILDNPKSDLIWTRTTQKLKMIRDHDLNPTRSELEWPKIRDDTRLDPIWTRTTWNLRWHKIR